MTHADYSDGSPPYGILSRVRSERHIEHSPQLQLLQELQGARLKRKKFLQAQVERNLVKETDIAQLASRRRQPSQLSQHQQLESLREVNKALRLKIRQKQRTIQQLLREREMPSENSQLQAMVQRNKKYLDQIKRRNMQFKIELQNMYTNDPRREAVRFAQLKQRLLDYQTKYEESQKEQLRLRQKLNEERQQLSQLSGVNEKYKKVLGQYEVEMERYKSEQQSESYLQQRLTFLLSQNTQITIQVEQLHKENESLRRQLADHETQSRQLIEKGKKQSQQLKKLCKQLREGYNTLTDEKDNLVSQLQKQKYQTAEAQKQINNLNLQIGNLERLRQLDREEAREAQQQQMQAHGLRNNQQIRSLKEEYSKSIRQLTQQNEQLEKQMQLLFEMKNRNEEQHLKSLKLLQKLERQRPEGKEQLIEARKKIEQLQLQNMRLVKDREEIKRQFDRHKSEKSQKQRNISVIDVQPSIQDSQNDIQFLRDELDSGHRNINILKEQLDMAEHSLRLKDGQLRDICRRMQQMDDELQAERQLRKSIEQSYERIKSDYRMREQQIDELLNKNAKFSQKMYEFNQKINNLQQKLQQEINGKDVLAKQVEESRQLTQKFQAQLKQQTNSSKITQQLTSKIKQLQQNYVQMCQKHAKQISEIDSANKLDKQSLMTTIDQQTQQIQNYTQQLKSIEKQLSIKDGQIQYLIEESMTMRKETQQTLDAVKQQHHLYEKQQQIIVSSLTQRVETTKIEIDQLRQKLKKYQQKQTKQNKDVKKRAEIRDIKLVTEIPNQLLKLLRDIKQYMALNKLCSSDTHLFQQKDKISEQACNIIKDTKEQLRTLLSQNFVLREAKRKLQKERDNLSQISQEMLLSDNDSVINSRDFAANNLKKKLDDKDKEIKNLHQKILSQETEFKNKINQLQMELTSRQGSNIDKVQLNWSDLRDDPDCLDYSYSTVKKTLKSISLKSQVDADQLQQIEQNCQAKMEFSNTIVEIIGRYLSLQSSKLAQIVLEFISQLYLYPYHNRLHEYLEGFLENVKYYEDHESRRVSEICSTVKQYFDEAEGLLETETDLLDALEDYSEGRHSMEPERVEPQLRRTSTDSYRSGREKSISKASSRKK